MHSWPSLWTRFHKVCTFKINFEAKYHLIFFFCSVTICSIMTQTKLKLNVQRWAGNTVDSQNSWANFCLRDDNVMRPGFLKGCPLLLECCFFHIFHYELSWRENSIKSSRSPFFYLGNRYAQHVKCFISIIQFNIQSGTNNHTRQGSNKILLQHCFKGCFITSCGCSVKATSVIPLYLQSALCVHCKHQT